MALNVPALGIGIVLAALSLSGCGEAGSGRADRGATARQAGEANIEYAQPVTDVRTFSTLGEFLGGYWLRPIPSQGPPPAEFSSLEASLQPSSCGTCHVQQYEDWQTTVHSGAYSPGFSGQLVPHEATNFGFVGSCLVCHAPLNEQTAKLREPDGRYLPNPNFDPELRDHGMVCAACHVRGLKRYGPPRRDGSTGPSPEGSPHGGVTRTTFFEDSRFCAGCHQFRPGMAAANGKLLENTFAEWEASRYAAEGRSCQSCHMPDRKHLWRGIHDPEMTASGVTIEWVGAGPGGIPSSSGEAGLRVTNTGTGHRFPTYVTPAVVVRLSLQDGNSRTLPGGTSEARISRQTVFQGGSWVELADTRLAPDSSMTLTVRIPAEARVLKGEVFVIPDEFYRGQYENMLSQRLSDTSRVLIQQAHDRSVASPFHIFDGTIDLAGVQVSGD